MPPKHDQPAPAAAASSRFASAAALAGMRKRITWCTIGTCARADARGRRVRILGKLGVEQEAAVVVGQARLRLRHIRRWHRERQEALAGTNLRLHSRRLAHGAGRLPARLGPAYEGRSLLRRQLSRVLADVGGRRRARRPRRHDPRVDGGADRLCPLRRLLRGLERERRDAADLVTPGALLAEDRRDVALEARCSRRSTIAIAARGGDGDDRHEQRGGDGGYDGSAPHAAGRCLS